jgi:tRNA A-37 threonylcarbamoyl transferase component Bud32
VRGGALRGSCARRHAAPQGGAPLAGPAVAVFARVMSRPLPSIVKPGQAFTLPRLIGERYLLERRLGRGGMADVYLATDRVLERKVAIKLMRQAANQPASVERFHREAVTLAALRSNHVVHLIDARVDSDGTYLVMEYVEGKSLHHLLTDTGALSPDRAIAIAAQVLDGLAVLHASRFVHRDVKPANILVDWSGRAVLVDLGLVFDPRRPALTPCDATAGTLSYMAPEQRVASGVDPRTDLYQVGLVLLHALTGADPSSLGGFPDQHVPAILAQVPAPLSSVLARALSAQASQRFGSAGEMKRALTDALHRVQSVEVAIGELVAHVPAPVAAKVAPARVRHAVVTPWVRRLRIGLVASAAVTASLGAAVLLRAPAEASGRRTLAPMLAPVAAPVAPVVVVAPAPVDDPAPHVITTDVVVAVEAAEAPPPVAATIEMPATAAVRPAAARRTRPAPPAPAATGRVVAFVSGDPMLRVARAHEAAGDLAAARTAYRAYLGTHPDGVDAAAVRRRLASLR